MAKTRRVTRTGGREAATGYMPGDCALAVGRPRNPTAPAGWEWVPLGEAARMESGHTPSRKRPEYWGGDIPWVGIRDAKAHHGGVIENTEQHTTELGIENSSARLLPPGTVCLSRTASVGYVVVLGREMATSQDFVNWVCCDRLDPHFLKYLFLAEKDALLRFGSGAVHKTIYYPQAKAFHVCLPPLTEQKRIVAMLDEAFEAIDAATLHAEKNLANANELFRAHLNAIMSCSDNDAEEVALGDVCDIASSLVDPQLPKYRDLPHIGAGNIIARTGEVVGVRTAREEGLTSGKYLFSDADVLYSKIRPYLMKACIPSSGGLCSADVYPLSPAPHRLNREYLLYILLGDDFTSYAVSGSARAGMPKVNRSHLFGYRFRLPSLDEQRWLAGRIQEAGHESQRLESLYQRKIEVLAELKQSMLHRAFAGDLPAGASAPGLTLFPMTAEPISTTDLHAGVLALAYEQHEATDRLDDFGHVKAEKMSHMIESMIGIDLGRQPVKDAAGPNDFQHLQKVEHRARKAGYFDFRKVEGGAYRVRKYRRFGDLIERTRAGLGDRCEEVEQLLRWMLPMKGRQPEIVATVYAAWNNLLLDGRQPTDEEVVYESRENWHPDKIKIRRERFFKAIEWMRKHGVVPTGNGQRVCAKEQR